MKSDIYNKLQAGIQHQQNNELLQAEECYRQVLEAHPDHPDALHLLGVLAYQIGDYDVAEDLIRHAVESDHAIADYHNNLGEVLRATGRIDDAREQYQQALVLDPTHQNALNNLQDLQQTGERNDSMIDNVGYLPGARQHQSSYLLSMDDAIGTPTQDLLDLSLLVSHKASKLQLQNVAERFTDTTARLINVWPGEHYRFLAALIDTLKPSTVIEIGTTDGASTLSMKSQLTVTGKITSYDPMPWNDYPGSGLSTTDFDRQLEHKVVDLSDPTQAETEKSLLEQAEIIFVDTLNDDRMTQKLCQLFDALTFKKTPLIIFNEIRTLPMLKIWRDIPYSKLDMTSFGHWTGTGLVEWNKAPG